jgi:hypothetical protein
MKIRLLDHKKLNKIKLPSLPTGNKKPCQILLLDRDKTKNKHYEQTLNFYGRTGLYRTFASKYSGSSNLQLQM